MLKTFFSAAVLCLIFSWTACTKTVTLDLHNAPPVFVIEGDITDQPGPYLVRIFQTKGFYDTSSFIGIDDATVQVSTAEGYQETLTGNGGGAYYTSQLQGRSGDTYTLHVVIGNNTYTAVSTMPQRINLDGLHAEQQFFVSKEVTYVVPDLINPLAPYIAYYYFDQIINGYLDKTLYYGSSKFSQGQANAFSLQRSSPDSTLHSGDTVTVTMQCISLDIYNYWSSLDLAATGTGAAYPGNPTTNIIGGALGYFSAHTSQTKGLRIP
jgi:Domain of unknown function (DUF4249)